MTPAISIIIPFYNQEKYLGKCIRSVIEQRFTNIEIILVNDGSTDRSLEICQKYAEIDNRIIVLNQGKVGVVEARKRGVLKSRSDYIAFIDSDDYFAPEGLEHLYNLAQKGIDLVIGNYDRVWDSWGFYSKKENKFELTDRLVENRQVLPLMLRSEAAECVYLWGRLYKRSCVMKALEADGTLLFPPYNVLEDGAFNLAISPYIESMWISNTIVIHHRSGGVTSRNYPYVTTGGFLFDSKYEYSLKYHCEEALPEVFNKYILLLSLDIFNQIHFKSSSKDEMIAFVAKELSERKIAIWAREHPSEINNRNQLKEKIIENDAEGFVNAAYIAKKKRWKHDLKIKALSYYQIIMDKVEAITQR